MRGRKGLLATLATRNVLASLGLLLALALAAGCSPSSGDTATSEVSEAPEDEDARSITLTHTSWDESYAIAVLTGVVLENDLGYDVNLVEASPEDALEGVSNGTYDAFQGVWLPGMEEDISGYRGISTLGRWYLGTTRAGFAVPDYMDTRSMRGVVEAGVEEAFVLAPEASALEEIPSQLVDDYGLSIETFGSVEGMISSARPLYEAEEPFVMLAYSPNRMSLDFDLTYIEGEEGLATLNAPQSIETVARSGLRRDHPEAYAFLNEVTLTESQIASLERDIRQASSPREGAETWLQSRGKFVNFWLSKVRSATS